MKKVMRFLMPQEKKFFGLLAMQSETALEASKELASFIGEYEKRERNERKQALNLLKSLNDKSKDTTREIILELVKSHRTPIDKDDISKLSVLIHDITCLANSAASMFVILGIERIDEYSPKLVNIMRKFLEEITESIRNLNKLKSIESHYSTISGLRDEAENIFESALSELFHFYKNSLDIIKYKEIYELLGKMIEKSLDVSFAISSIVAKRR